MANCCEVSEETFLAPNIDVSTRWNSTFDMLQKAFKMQKSLMMLCKNNAFLKDFFINSEQWLILRETGKYLEYFKTLSDILSGEKYATIPIVIVGFNLLLDKLDKAKENLYNAERTIIDDKILEGLEAATEKLLKHYRKSHWVYCAILILDPKHKVETFSKTSWGKEMECESLKKFEKIFQTEYFKLSIKIFQYY